MVISDRPGTSPQSWKGTFGNSTISCQTDIKMGKTHFDMHDNSDNFRRGQGNHKSS